MPSTGHKGTTFAKPTLDEKTAHQQKSEDKVLVLIDILEIPGFFLVYKKSWFKQKW